jgi:hypothetical protein
MLNVNKTIGWSASVIAILVFVHGCVSLTAELSEGERLYRAKCSSCHRLIGPEEHDAPAWRHYVDEYGQGLTGNEKQRILYFLTGGQEEAGVFGGI